MLRCKYDSICPLTILLALSVTQCRKYDIEQEARTLYGESLKSLMERFRRTAKYLAILNDEVDEMQKRLVAVGDRVAYVFSLQLYDQVMLEMGANVTNLRAAARLPPGASQFQTTRNIFHLPGSSRNEEDAKEVKELEELFQRPNNILLRQSQHKSPINLLDGYEKFHCPLTLAERNRMKEIGYKYIGLALHALIDNMSPEDSLPISTLLPDGGHPGKSISHHHHHEITKPSTEPGTMSTVNQHHHSTNAHRHY